MAIETATGLTGPQLWALREISLASDGVTLGDLARRLALHKANAGRLADRRAGKRLVTRETPADDRRVVIVRATGVRKAAIHVATPPQAHLVARLDELPPPELQAIEGSLRRLVELLGVEGEEAGPLLDQRSSEHTTDEEDPRPRRNDARRGRETSPRDD